MIVELPHVNSCPFIWTPTHSNISKCHWRGSMSLQKSWSVSPRLQDAEPCREFLLAPTVPAFIESPAMPRGIPEYGGGILVRRSSSSGSTTQSKYGLLNKTMLISLQDQWPKNYWCKTCSRRDHSHCSFCCTKKEYLHWNNCTPYLLRQSRKNSKDWTEAS